MALDYIKFGSAVKKIRIDMKLSQVEVHKKTGISVETQRILENGKREPKISTLERLSEFYKVNLIFLLDQYRDDCDLFSDKLIEETTTMLNSKNFPGFRDRINQIIDEIEVHYTSDKYRRNNLEYINYLRSFKDIQYDDVHDKENNTTNLKQILFYFSSSRTEILHDAHLYTLEIQIALYLATLARQKDQLEASRQLLQTIIDRLEAYPALTTRQEICLNAAYFNMVYYLFRMKKYEETITMVDEVLRRKNIRFKREFYSEMVIKKATAYFKLGDTRYMPLLQSVIMNETPARASYYAKVMLEHHGIELTVYEN